ncbi:hypothetical protein D9M70_517030 [compost metagenome]
MPMRAMAREGMPLMRWPRNSTSPEVGVSTPESWLNRVLLPAPLGPIRARISPARTSRFMSLLATRPPKRRVTLRASSSTSPALGSSRRGSSAASLTALVVLRGFQLSGTRRSSSGQRPPGARCISRMMIRPKTITS